MQGQCKPNAESSLYAEVQPVLAFRRQSYDENPLIANISALFSPNCSDNPPQRRQIRQMPKNFVHCLKKRRKDCHSQNNCLSLHKLKIK